MMDHLRMRSTRHAQLQRELRTLMRLVREERVLLTRLQRWWWALAVLAGVLGGDTTVRMILWWLAQP